MQDLLKSIENTINESVKQFVFRIIEKYDNMDEDTLLELWTDTKSAKAAKSAKAPKSAKATKSADDTENQSVSGCQYKPTKGKNSGKVCGIKPKDGGTYCATHKKYEGQEPKEKKVVPEPKKGKSKTSPPAKNVQRVVRNHKTLNKLYHPDTDLVFKSAQDRVVIGKIVNNKIENLTEDDIEVCKQWGFQYDTTKDSSNLKNTQSDQDESPVKKPAKAEKPKKEEDSEDEEDSPVKKPVKAEKPKKEDKPAKSEKQKPKKEEDSEDEEESPVKKPVKTEKPKKEDKPTKAEKQKPKKEEDSEDEEESSVKKSVKSDKVKKSKASADTEELIEDLDAAETVVKKALGIKQDDEVEEELEDDE